MRIIITEKPSVARQFAQALKVSGTKEGYIEGHSPVDNVDYVITWAIGHLIAMSYPEKYGEHLKKWNLDDLPFIPEKYKYELIPQVAKQFKVIKGLYHREDLEELYYAGDAGREGEYIQRLIRQAAGVRHGVKEKRIWIDSQTDAEILRGIREAKALSCYDSLSESAYLRAKEDYLVGINFSRALSCAFGREYNSTIRNRGDWKTISVGRVMTCVLGMVVDREEEIRSFVEEDFYKIEADTGFKSTWKVSNTSDYFNSPLLFNDAGFRKEKDAEFFCGTLNSNKTLTVKKLETETVKKYAPALYNLAELQGECTKRLKISPDETLKVAQSLYEKKLTTYPRTDARVLSTAVAEELEPTLKRLSIKGYAQIVNTILNRRWTESIKSNKRYCDDAKVTDHYAIIPTGEGDVSQLNELEEKVYNMIAVRFLSIFYPPATFNKTQVALYQMDKERFHATEEVLTSPGFLEVADPSASNKPSALANVKEGDVLNAVFSVKAGKTQPPKRYTSGSMVLAMENAGKLIEDEELREQIKTCGIGTSATRAEVIKKLVTIGYLNLDKKTQVITPHPDGEGVYRIAKKYTPELLNPRMTASWEKGLEQVKNRELTPDIYMEKLSDFIKKTVEKVKENAAESNEQAGFERREFSRKCPVCGKKLLSTKKGGYGCEGYNDGSCQFYLSSTISGKAFSDAELEEILDDIQRNGRTRLYKGFISKAKKHFEASLAIKEGKLCISFEKQGSGKSCPSCQKELMEDSMAYSCSCGFRLYKSIAKKNLTADDIDRLLKGETVHVLGMTSKAGKKFDAALKLERDGKIKFEK